MSKEYYVYMISNYNRSVLYIGVTNNLVRRIDEHRVGLADGFTKRYKCKYLLYFETTNNIEAAILREKQLKNWRRDKKDRLILTSNPGKKDLSTEIL
jgi:putative endonuclease